VEPLKYKKPPFKSRVRVPVELDDNGSEDITFFAVDQEWKYLATCRSYRSEFDKDNEPKKKSNDYLDIWVLPDGIHKSRIRLPKFNSDMMRWYASPYLKQWIYSDLSGELHIVKLDDLLADGLDLSETASTLKAKFNEFAVDESQGRIFFLSGWREISVASISSDPKVEKRFTVECLKDDDSISKIAISTMKQKLFIGTNKGRVIQICANTMKEEQIVQLKRKKGPELLQVTSNGEKLLISGKGYLQVRDCSDLSCFTDLTDRSSGSKSNLGFPRCVQDFHDGQLLISGHDDSARVWDIQSGKLLWFIPVTLRSGQEKVLQIVPSPTEYHFLYRTKSRLF
jgi:WD40 repeat protein